MKKFLVLTLVAVLVGFSVPAGAAQMWDDMSWWGNTGATPDPVQDPVRSGYWWWPTEAASNVDDGELWGNRGIVYHIWEPAPKVAEVAAPIENPCVERTVIVLNNVLFDFDKFNLKAEGQAEVNKLIGEMTKYPKDTVVIEGHTCDIGTDAYNMGLGQRRADSVQSFMLQNGVDASRLSTVSHGESRPAVPNDTAANRKLNRRAEFKITLGEPCQ